MLFGHTHETIISCDHQETIVWLRAEETEDCSAKIALVACQVGERYHFSLNDTR